MGDITERGHWQDYMDAYERALGETAKPWAPWYAIPADDKPFMRLKVAEIIVDALKSLPLKYPELHEDEMNRLIEARRMLEAEA